MIRCASFTHSANHGGKNWFDEALKHHFNASLNFIIVIILLLWLQLVHLLVRLVNDMAVKRDCFMEALLQVVKLFQHT